MGNYIILATVILGCLFFPMVINRYFSYKHYQRAFEPVPITLNTIGLFTIIIADANGELIELAIVFAILMYAISIFLVVRSARELGCANGDTILMILANALLPVSIILFILIFLTASTDKKKKRRN